MNNFDEPKLCIVVAELMDLPSELLHLILIEVGIASVRGITHSEDDVIEDMLTSLADVCRQWSAIVNDTAGYFRRKFWEKLVRVGMWRLQKSPIITQLLTLHNYLRGHVGL